MNGTKHDASPATAANRPRRRRRLFDQRRRSVSSAPRPAPTTHQVPSPEPELEEATPSLGSVPTVPPPSFEDAEVCSRPTLVPFLALGWLLDEE